MFYQPTNRDTGTLPQSPVNAIVAPRPIGWIATVSRAGQTNLAPYSFFNVVCGVPPIVAFSSVGPKDTATFARETGEFTYNLATDSLREQVNQTSIQAPRGESEFKLAGLTPVPSVLVKPPRVTESPASFECVVTEIVDLRDRQGKAAGAFLIIGEVIGIHIDDRYLRDGRFDTVAARPLARCGYRDFAVVAETFSMAAA
ncbi:MAG: flavin reductase [Alphaproteobacteria bacterium]|nr:MAG: flavin reductase [Alphaproteobacteria bacterium]